jgi:hypothetical protein
MKTNAGKSDSQIRTTSRCRLALLIATGGFVLYQHHAVVTQIAEARAAQRVDRLHVLRLEEANRHASTIIADLTKENTELHLKVARLTEMESEVGRVQENEQMRQANKDRRVSGTDLKKRAEERGAVKIRRESGSPSS